MRAYISFETNIPDSKKDLATVEVASITLKHERGGELEIMSYGDTDYLAKSGRYDARWKGLEFIISDCDSSETQYISDDDEDIPDKVFEGIIKGIKESVPSSIEYYWEDNKSWNVPGSEFVPVCKNATITIMDGDDIIKKWECINL